MKIMMGYHDVSLDSKIVKTALDRAKRLNAQLNLVTSMTIGEGVPKIEFDMAEEDLTKGKQFFLDQGIDCIVHLFETGLTAGEGLVKFALDNQMDELILGVRSRSKLGKLIFGSTAQYVILHASCPVLSVNEEDNS
ncbi:MAG: universal stress protein [Proteobacteria bacterium]|nr:universal stress protein [Pseudomonadota bacterium]